MMKEDFSGTHSDLTVSDLKFFRQLVSDIKLKTAASFVPTNTFHSSISCHSVSHSSPNSWIIDSGASEHMTCNSSLLQSYHYINKTESVRVANGTHVPVHGWGTSNCLPSLPLSSVLHVPSLSVNLLSVHQITENLNCSVTFFPSHCVFQDLATGKVLGSGKVINGLYIMEGNSVSPSASYQVRAGVEMALIDAVANSIGTPLWRLFGGVSNTITTDITIPIVSSSEAAQLASKYRKQGFKTLKLKVGKNLNGDIEVLQAIRTAHPGCLFILDANEGYTSTEAIQVLQTLHEMKVTPILFEQPVHRDDWEGLGHVTRIAKEKYGVSVAADESCRGLADVKKIVKGNLADVVNIKLAKVGVIGALEIIELAKASGLYLMIGGMVETRLAMGFAGHLAAGLGCFKFIDLDTPLLLSEDPVHEGYEVSGPVYKFTNARGSGSFLHWNNID